MKQKNFKGAVILIGGIVIGIALTAICMHSVERSTADHKLVAAKAPVEAHKSRVEQPPGAVLADAPQAEPAAAPALTNDWLKPEDVAAQAATQNGEVPAGTAAADTAKAKAPNYQSSNTTYYVYSSDDSSGQALPTAMNGYPAAVQGETIGENGLIQNPCVDPPSVTSGRAYRRPQQ